MRMLNRVTIGSALALLLSMGLIAGTEAQAQDSKDEGTKTKTLRAQGLSMEVPEPWKSVEPESRMRALQLEVGPAEGDEDPAELVVFAFPGGAGGVDANVQRWRRQFANEDGRPAKASTEKVEGQNIESTFVEIAGRYVAAVRPGSPQRYDKPDYLMLGGIAMTPKLGYFIKMVGPDKTVKQARPGFKKMLESLEVANR